MDNTTESTRMNGKLQESKKFVNRATMDLGEEIPERVKDGVQYVEKKAKEYTGFLSDYAKDHPGRMAITAVGLGLLTGIYLARRK